MAPGAGSERRAWFVAAWLVHLTGKCLHRRAIVYPTVGLNVRARPTTEANIVTIAVPGDELSVLGDKARAQSLMVKPDQWLQVQTPVKLPVRGGLADQYNHNNELLFPTCQRKDVAYGRM